MYNNGNMNKYMTKNKLKARMLNRFEDKLLSYIKHYARKKDNVKILDAGCGEGFTCRMIEENVDNCEIIGLEYEQKALDIARSLMEDNSGRIKYIQGDIRDISLPDESFDIVLCSEVLEHLDAPEKALEELQRLCKAKGVLIITVPREPWFCLGNLLVLKNVKRLGNPPDHINHWTYSGFKKFIGKNLLGHNIRYDTSFPWSIAVVKK